MRSHITAHRAVSTVLAGALAVSLGGALASSAVADPNSAHATENSSLVTIEPGDTLVSASGDKCTVTKKFFRPSAENKAAYAAYGVNGWGLLQGNCGKLSGFWVRTAADEVRGIVEKTPAAKLAGKGLPPQSKTMKEIGEPAYLKGQKDKGVVGWVITTGVGLSFIGVNRNVAQYEGPADYE